MAAGCIAGGIEATAVWPMEYIKVRVSVFLAVFLLRRNVCVCMCEIRSLSLLFTLFFLTFLVCVFAFLFWLACYLFLPQ